MSGERSSGSRVSLFVCFSRDEKKRVKSERVGRGGVERNATPTLTAFDSLMVPSCVVTVRLTFGATKVLYMARGEEKKD
jgi:hypothetical protein